MQTETKRNFLINTAFIATVAAMIYLTAKLLLSYLLPFVIGVTVAVLLQKPARKIAKRTKADTGVCAALLTAATYILIISVLTFVIWQLWVHLPDFSKSLSTSFKSLDASIEKWRTFLSGKISHLKGGMAQTLKSLTETSLDDILSRIGGAVSGFATSFVKRIPAFLISSVVTIAASCYIAKDFERLTVFLREILSPTSVSNILAVRDILFNRVFKLAAGYLTLMLITFVELFIGFLVLGINGALPLALITSTVDLLPVLGTGTVLIPWAIFRIITDGIKAGLGLLILYVAITVVRNVIEPKIIGKRIGITPLLTLLTMFLGLRVAGVAGVFLFPLALITVIEFYKKKF